MNTSTTPSYWIETEQNSQRANDGDEAVRACTGASLSGTKEDALDALVDVLHSAARVGSILCPEDLERLMRCVVENFEMERQGLCD